MSYITNLSNALNSESMLLKYLSWDFIWAREETPPPEAHITYYCWQSDLRGKNEVWAESSGDFFIPWGPLNLTENYFFVTKWRRGGGDLKWFKKKKRNVFFTCIHVTKKGDTCWDNSAYSIIWLPTEHWLPIPTEQRGMYLPFPEWKEILSIITHISMV